MSVETVKPSVNYDDEVVNEILSEGTSDKKSNLDVDARRRLEDKLEELRLKRELRDYDFDL